MLEVIDHPKKAIKRLATEYSQSTNIIAFIKALLSESNGLESVFHQLLYGRTIEDSVGVTLDIIGAIVGQPRVLVDAENFTFFGYLGSIGSGTYGEVNDPDTGERFRSVDEPATGNRTLNDIEYRLFINARIIKNKTTATREDIIEAVLLLIPDVTAVRVTEGDMTMLVEIDRQLTDNELLLVTNSGLFPKGSGVALTFGTIA